jgi:hypothetical protein
LRDEIRTAAKNVGSIAAVAGVLIYAALWLAYSLFYAPFGLAPRDLGYDYKDLLAESVGLLLMLALYVGWVAILLVVIYRLVNARRPLDLTREKPVLAVLAAAILLVLTYFEFAAHIRGRDAANGDPHGPMRVFGLPLLDAHAEPVVVRDKAQAATDVPPARESLTGCLLYLGQDAGTTILFAPRGAHKDLVIKVPSSAVSLEVVIPPFMTPCALGPDGK